ncbi:M4 family metallopeptidase [Flavobacterium sp. JP2137]|uniref:M4 family metallopeptidase n=1 Tax=Flavobacterium sp. JP2137 TaxID=3414510 RepID=UPI003D2FE4F1
MKRKSLSLHKLGSILYLSFLLVAAPAQASIPASSPTAVEIQLAVAANKVPKIKTINDFGSFFMDLESHKLTVSEVLNGLNESFDLNANHTFKEVSSHTDDLKTTHTHFQHYFKGIAVDGEMIFIHSKGNIVQSINGQLSVIKDQSVAETLSDERALDIAKSRYKIEELAADYPVTAVFAKVENSDGSIEKVLAKRVRIDSFEPLVMAVLYIAQESGVVINTVDLIHDADVSATGQTHYRGRQNITADSFSGGFRLRDQARNVETYDASSARMNPSGSFSGLSDIVSTTTDFVKNPAVDAHWGIGKTYDYYNQKFNRDSYDTRGGVIKNYYNAVILETIMPESGYPNNAGAFPPPYNFMVYGRGDGREMGPVVGLDVTGHEFTHIVVEYNGSEGLIYQGESGALNESFADIFGTAIEFYVNSNPNWTIGENIMLRGGAMRSMSNPNLFNNPDTYKGRYWISTLSEFDNGGVHINSGVQNHWFYLLTEGGSGTNDLNKSYTVNGIGIAKAEKIAYRNLTTYLTKQATFLDAYNGSVRAAKDLYGENSPEYEAVLDAWYAVGIGERMSVTENEITSNLAVYPNPANSGTVFINTQVAGVVTVEAFDLLGKRVLNTTTLNKGENTINVQAWSNGVYFLKFNANGQVHSQKLMINN